LFALKFKNTVSYVKYVTQFLCRHVSKMFYVSATTVSIRGVQVLNLDDGRVYCQIVNSYKS